MYSLTHGWPWMAALAGLLWLNTGCVSRPMPYRRSFALADGRKVTFLYPMVWQRDKPLGAASARIAQLFNHSPDVLLPFTELEGPIFFVYEVQLGDEPWYTGKGPLTVELPNERYLNFGYIVEAYDRKSDRPMEYLRLGNAFAVRYFLPVPAVEDSVGAQLLVMGLYDQVSIAPRSQWELRKIIASTEIR